MSLFDFLKPKQVAPTKSKPNTDLAYQNRLLASVNKANERYKKDGDLSAIISAYEHAFREADPPCRSSQYLKLANYYVKAGENGKAWAYLNEVISRYPDDRWKIRKEQGRILKSEKKHLDSIRMYMFSYLAKYGDFRRDSFLKDISVSVKAEEITEDQREELADLLADQIRRKDLREDHLDQKYRTFLSQIGK